MIKYTKRKGTRRKKRSNFPLVVLGLIAIMIGIDIGVVIIACILIGLWTFAKQPRYTNFEIKLDRRENQISIHNSDQANPKVTTHALDKFRGFEYSETPPRGGSKKMNQAELFFRFGPSKDLPREVHVPVRKHSHPAPVKNIADLIAAADNWLRLTTETRVIEESQNTDPLRQEEPEEETEIFRDFRDME